MHFNKLVIIVNAITLTEASSPLVAVESNVLHGITQNDASGSIESNSVEHNLSNAFVDLDKILTEKNHNMEQTICQKHFSCKDTIIDFKANTIFHFIKKAITFIINHKTTVNSVISNLYIKLKHNRKDTVFIFLSHMFVYLEIEHDYFAKNSLDYISDFTYSVDNNGDNSYLECLYHLLFIANRQSDLIENDWECLEQKVIETYEDLTDIDTLQQQRRHENAKIVAIALEEELGITSLEGKIFTKLLGIIYDMVLCIPFVFTNLDTIYLETQLITCFSVACKGINKYYTAANILFMFCFDFLIYLYEINFIPGSTISNNVHQVRCSDIINVSTHINILHKMIVAQSNDINFQVQLPSINLIESSFNSTQYHKNMIYNFIRFFKAVEMQAKLPASPTINDIVERYINNTIGLFCYHTTT